jgi:aspartate/methionine/tyrosine aminotransferase
MFSRRLQWPCPPNRLSRLLEEKRSRGTPLLDLTESNPTRAGLPYPSEALAAALSAPGVETYEPSARGLVTARAAVAEDAERRGRPVPRDRIVLTASTSEAYALLFKLLADPGDTVVVPRPSYPLFDYLAALEGLRVATYPLLHDDRFSIDLDVLGRALDVGGAATPRAVVLVNPNNPTGTALRRDERTRLRELCAARGAALISDEVFLDFLDQDEVDAAARSGNPIVPAVSFGGVGPAGHADGAGGPLTFALGGLSKACGLPLMKLGWIVADGPGTLVAEALERLDLIADTYLSVGTPVMRAAGRLLEIGAQIRTVIRRRLAENLQALRGRLDPGSACRLLRCDGGWYAVLQVPALVPEEDLVLTLLSEDDVLVHPGYFFDFPGEAFLVLSLLPPPADFDEAIRRILARVDRR